MTYLLIAVAMVACLTYIGLRLHSFSLPPLPRFPAAVELHEAMRSIGAAAQQAAAMQAAFSAAFWESLDPSMPDAYRWAPDLENEL